MKKIFRFINNINLKNKLIFIFLLVSIIPILIIGMVSYNVSSDIVIEREVNEKMQTLNMIIQNIVKIVDNKQIVGIKFHLDKNVQSYLGQESTLNLGKSKKFKFNLEKLLFDYKNSYGTSSIYLFSRNDVTYTNNDDGDLKLGFYQSRKWFKNARNRDKNYFWGDIENINGEYVIPYIRIITDINSFKKDGKILGVLAINLKESYLKDSYEKYRNNTPGFYFIVNSSNTIISVSGKEEFLGEKVDKLGVDITDIDNQKGYFEKDVNGDRYLFIYNTDKKMGWKFFSIVPVEELVHAFRDIKRITFMLSLLSLFICLVISLFLSQRITEPINKLMRMMKKAEEGDLSVRFSARYNDEIGKLADSFDRMIARLKRLLQRTILIEKEKRKAELKVLEFQINPHFLYNSLSSIIWLSNAGDNQRVIKLTKALSNFFRISISKGKEIIKIQNEIDHVKNYLAIQKIRYSDEFELIYDLSSDIMDYYTPKLILQPLVENAIYHGIKNVENRSAIIKLEGFINKGIIIFRVIDNGNTLNTDKIKYINNFLKGKIKEEENFGIAIKNVNDRIKLYFGSEYGLVFKKEGIYTVAEITIPLAEEGDIGV